MKIAILGYSGFIGESIIDDLNKNPSLNLVCVARRISKNYSKSSRIKYFKWDFVSFKKENLLFLNKVDIIINCVGKTTQDNSNLEYINFFFLKKLLKYISKHKLNVRLIHLSSISVYGNIKSYLNQNKLITENSLTKTDNLYAKSKLKADKLIQNTAKKKSNKNFSYTILRISNVFGKTKNSNLYNFVLLTLKTGFWIRSSDNVFYNFINVNDVSRAIMQIIKKLIISKNKIYILSDDCQQKLLFNAYRKFFKKNIINIKIPLKLIKFVILFCPLPKKIFNFLLIISSKVTYSNAKIKKELNFRPAFSFLKTIKKIK